jgi:starvation-inducible DNA-binding protein
MNDSRLATTVPALSKDLAEQTIDELQSRLVATLDLQLTLKHVHWNVVGMNFIAVHEMLDPQVDAVRAMSDTIAERIATLGGEPQGTPAAITSNRTWNDYPVGRAPTVTHLAALDSAFAGVIADHRDAATRLGDLDPVSQDMLIGQLAELELFQWFVRAHLQDADGRIVHRNSSN